MFAEDSLVASLALASREDFVAKFRYHVVSCCPHQRHPSLIQTASSSGCDAVVVRLPSNADSGQVQKDAWPDMNPKP